MKPGGQRKKGNRYEYFLRDWFKEHIDIATRQNYMSGGGLDKGDLRIPSLNLVIEAKNAKTIHLLADWEQAKEQALGDDLPALIIRNPKLAEFKENLVVISLEHFTDLLQGNLGHVEVSQQSTYSQRSALNSLKT